ncbi:hypothetical protein [Arthrobacter sp. NPDC093139]|uniref:hypothetical protein n=1 Tax=Arthrobacter sp. NPDC093139 TaxID=3363945 RepID=UPI0037F9470C
MDQHPHFVGPGVQTNSMATAIGGAATIPWVVAIGSIIVLALVIMAVSSGSPASQRSWCRSWPSATSSLP